MTETLAPTTSRPFALDSVRHGVVMVPRGTEVRSMNTLEILDVVESPLDGNGGGGSGCGSGGNCGNSGSSSNGGGGGGCHIRIAD